MGEVGCLGRDKSRGRTHLPYTCQDFDAWKKLPELGDNENLVALQISQSYGDEMRGQVIVNNSPVLEC